MTSPESMLKKVLDNTINKLKNSELKKFLKDHSCSSTGDKQTAIWRIKCFLDGQHLQVDGQNPAVIKGKGKLKKICAKFGLSCLGNNDELLEVLMNHLREEHPDKVVTAGAKPGEGGNNDSNSGASKGIKIAKRILELNEECDYVGILSVMGHELTENSSVKAYRKAYLKISLLIHPDKLPGKDATNAFQAAVHAFERLSKPELFVEAEEATKGPKRKKISRSNSGCKVTKIYCPRCKQIWGRPVDGVPKYAYNFFMQAIKTYHCATCLLDFGCMSAIHKCPACKGEFEYSPSDYHRKISCGNSKCKITFGFWMYHVPASIENSMRKQVKSEQEKRMKREEAKRKRAARTKRKHQNENEVSSRREQVRLFQRGLLDKCPLCGFVPTTDGEEVEHLRVCKKDKSAWKKYKAEMEKEKAKSDAKKAKVDAQSEAQNLAAWEFLGGSTSSMWMLTMRQLKKQCSTEGLKEDGSKDELIMRLSAHRAEKDSRLLTDGTSNGRKSRRSRKKAFTLESLPDNLYSMSVPQIRSVCAAHGFLPKMETKDEIIEEIEAQFRKDVQLLLK